VRSETYQVRDDPTGVEGRETLKNSGPKSKAKLGQGGEKLHRMMTFNGGDEKTTTKKKKGKQRKSLAHPPGRAVQV